MNIRTISGQDFGWVLELNRENVEMLSPLDEAGLAALLQSSFCAFTAPDEAGFLIAFDQTGNYDSPNFLWFRDRYAEFVYVDRIAVAGTAQGKGIARHLYEAMFRQARDTGHERIVCEVNVDPPNPGSDRFHEQMGFTVVGRATLDGGKVVRYWCKELER